LSRRQEREPVTTVCKSWTFDAAHQLPNHDGKCRFLHGHTYRVEVFATGYVNPKNGRSDEGMVVDFGVLSRVWREDVEPWLDHQFLNDTLADEGVEITTAENIAGWILTKMAIIPGVHKVRVWETPTSFAEVVTSSAVDSLIDNALAAAQWSDPSASRSFGGSQ
jgi:6-pyruvoyltetrahydropterin/6-carboxytetrahydropterin synthase